MMPKTPSGSSLPLSGQALGGWVKPTPMTMRTELNNGKVNEVEIVYRSVIDTEPVRISTSQDAAQVLRPLFGQQMETRELFYLLMLDRGLRVRATYLVSCGGVHGTVADPKMIFAAALKCLASVIIVAHNHPSGQLRPSEEDIRLTQKLIQGAKILDIMLSDHLIMTREGYYSFADNGMMLQ